MFQRHLDDRFAQGPDPALSALLLSEQVPKYTAWVAGALSDAQVSALSSMASLERLDKGPAFSLITFKAPATVAELAFLNPLWYIVGGNSNREPSDTELALLKEHHTFLRNAVNSAVGRTVNTG